MEPGESSAGCEKSAYRGLGAVLAGMGLLLAGGGWIAATPASAATCTGNPCDSASRRDLQRFEIAAYNPAADIADPSSAGAGTAGATSAESMAPLLYLTPRVTSILEHVFGDSRDDAVAAAPLAAGKQEIDDDPAAAEAVNRPVSPPLADTDSVTSASDRYGPPAALDNASNLPKFQRQMYRTDI